MSTDRQETTMSTTVTEIFEGALESEFTFTDPDEAYRAADKLVTTLTTKHADADWQVYVLEGDIQYATDHHPYASSDSARKED